MPCANLKRVLLAVFTTFQPVFEFGSVLCIRWFSVSAGRYREPEAAGLTSVTLGCESGVENGTDWRAETVARSVPPHKQPAYSAEGAAAGIAPGDCVYSLRGCLGTRQNGFLACRSHVKFIIGRCWHIPG